ncbi:MAG: hypothetical protein K2K70_07285 [Lachnospiraceae bacterium]|nr:hypothetical protein [Lachnospiraceae bacterium]
MKERLLIAWKQKYERIQWELEDNLKKLENVEKRKRELIYDLVFQFFFAVFCFLLLYCITVNRYAITVEAGYFFAEGFYYILVMFLIIGAIAAVIYNTHQIIKRIKRYLWHVTKWDLVEYPKPENVRSNYPTHIPLNYFAEQACIEWLLHEYVEDMKKLTALKRKIEDTPEQNLDPLWKELEDIVFYERVGRARL